VKRGEPEEALRVAREAVQLAQATDALVDHADARLALATVLSETGRGDRGRSETARAVELYEQKGATALAARARGHGHDLPPSQPGAGAHVGGVRVAQGVDRNNLAWWERSRAAMVGGDWDSFESGYHPDVIVTDDRAGLRAEVVGRDAYVGGIRGTYEGRQFDVEVDILASTDHVGVIRNFMFSTGDDLAGAWETDRLVVFALDATGDLMVRLHFVDPADREKAFALFRTWSAGVRAAPGVDPRHLEWWTPFRAAMVERDWHAFGSFWHSETLYADRRPGLQSEVHGREETVRVIRETFGKREFESDVEILASRGNAAVAQTCFFGPGDTVGGPWEAERLVLTVLDDDNLLLRAELFPPDDREAVLSLLDRYGPRPMGVRAAPGVSARFVAFGERLRAALASKDWDAYGSCFHPDVLYADRRPGLQFEVRGRDEVVRIIRESFGTREFDYDVEILASRGDAVVSLGRFLGLGDELGGPWEAERLAFVVLDENDQMVRSELFDPGDIESPFELLREYSGGGVRASSGVDPRHVEIWERFREAFVATDWEALATVLDPDLVHLDRRPGLQSEVSGREEYIRVMRESFGTRDIDYDVEILTSQGDAGLTLNYVLGRGVGGPFEAERLVCFVVKDRQQFGRFELFDSADRETAQARLGELAHTESAVGALVWRFVDAYNARDWAAFEASVSPDLELNDHRALGWGTSKGFDPFFARIRVGVEAAPDARVAVESWLRESENVALVRMPMRGRVAAGGGEFELDRLFVVAAAAGRIAVMEIFDLDDDRAVQRFEELEQAAKSRAD
jgi:limonene-1,2-epoxide hydrolase